MGLLALLSGWPFVPAGASQSPGESGRLAQAYHLYSRAQQALLQRDYATALQLLERAAARDPSPSLLMELAHLRYSLNDLERAADLTRRIGETAPDHPGLARLMGDIELSLARGGDDSEKHVELAIENYRRALQIQPGDLDACRPLAQLLYQKGDLEETVELLEGFSRIHSLDPSLALILGKADLGTGRLREAEKALERVIKSSPLNSEAVDTLASLYEHEGRYEEAIDLYAFLLETTSPSAYLRNRLGALYLQVGRYLDAVRELEEGRRLEPDDYLGLFSLAQAYEETGATENALATYAEAVQADPDDVEARFYRARLLELEGYRDEALSVYQEIIERTDRGDPADEQVAAMLQLAHSQIGLIYLGDRDFEAASKAFNEALEVSVDPGPELLLMLGRTSLEGGMNREVEKILSLAEERFPDDLDLQILRGEFFFVEGDPERARAYYGTLIKDTGETAESYTKISEAFLRRKRFGDAESLLENATRKHPSSDELFFARGAANERMGEIEAAERFLTRAIDLNPTNAMALNYLGYMLAERGVKLSDSIRYVERALEIDPRNAAYLDSLGWAQYQSSQFGPAEESLTAALRYDRSDPTIREHLGDLYAATGRFEDAIREWERALSRKPEDPEQLRSKIDAARSSLGERE